MGKIQILPPELVNQIAAGEVVERPASVVKELVENAMDAGATRVEIAVSEAGRFLRVADNGSGMGEDDLQVAFRNHATSKVKTLADLFEIRTLGFRGEALASIAAISKLTCSSRPQGKPIGLKAQVSPAGDVTLQETGCAEGTIFEVRELFYNVPARLKFLKRPQTELSHIQEMVQMLALSHPEIAFKLDLESSTALKTSGSGEVLKTMHEVFSLAEADALIPFELGDAEADTRVWGHTGTPNVTRGSRKWMMTFVNGRGVKCPILGKAIETAYQSLMTPGKFPVTVLFLEIPPDEVDVNVHPTKKEVKYQHANTLFSFVRKALDVAFASLPMASTPGFGSATRAADSPSPAFPTRNPGFSSPPPMASSHRVGGSSGAPAFPREPQADTRTALGLYQPIPQPTVVSDATYLPQVSDYRVIGQLSRTYILVENEQGLLVVDQHIAAERVLFERFSEQMERAEPASQTLLLPLAFPVSPTLRDTLDVNREKFAVLGFAFNFTPDAQVAFTQVPSLYNEKVLKSSLAAMLAQLEDSPEVTLSVDDVIATAACHSAIRAGDLLNTEQMTRTITQWLDCKRPWTCPHGRPVSHQMTHRHLMNFFERPSLPEGIAERPASV